MVIAQSFERLHRSNLVGMGVLPCQFMRHDGPNAQPGRHGNVSTSPGLRGSQSPPTHHAGSPPRECETLEVPLILRIDTPIEMILPATAVFCVCCGNCWRARLISERSYPGIYMLSESGCGSSALDNGS